MYGGIQLNFGMAKANLMCFDFFQCSYMSVLKKTQKLKTPSKIPFEHEFQGNPHI